MILSINNITCFQNCENTTEAANVDGKDNNGTVDPEPGAIEAKSNNDEVDEESGVEAKIDDAIDTIETKTKDAEAKIDN